MAEVVVEVKLHTEDDRKTSGHFTGWQSHTRCADLLVNLLEFHWLFKGK